MDTFEDRAFSFVAIALVAALAFRTIAPQPASPPERRDPVPVIVDLPMPSRVMRVAEAIARSEGYYAPGNYGGHSLPYFLNNPGLLKATALADDEPTTWRDTGLLVFETPEIGWAALRRQVCLMLTGTSRRYAPGDSLEAVGLKYADGDAFWAVNVASHLRLSPQITLADLGSGVPAGLACLTS